MRLKHQPVQLSELQTDVSSAPFFCSRMYCIYFKARISRFLSFRLWLCLQHLDELLEYYSFGFLHFIQDGIIGETLLLEVEKKIDKWQEPPPVKQVKALAAPIDPPAK